MLTFADRDVSLEDLETVLTVSEYGAFNRAGEILNRARSRRGFRKARCIGRGENAMLEIGHSTYLDPSVVAYLSNIAKAPNVGFSAVYHSSWSAEIVANVQAGVWDGPANSIPVDVRQTGILSKCQPHCFFAL